VRVRYDGTTNYDSRDFFGGPVGDCIGVYLGQLLPRSTNYSIIISESIKLLSVLDNSPGLTHLTLKGSHPILVEGPTNKIYRNLVTLKIGIYSFSKNLCRFIAHNLTNFRTLKFYSGFISDSSVLIDRFEEFNSDQGRKSPSVSALSFNNLHGLAFDFVELLPVWFPNLEELLQGLCIYRRLG
jgi:predicted CopG family antitoxin